MKLLNEVIRQLEDIESSLNQDTPNISDVRIDVVMLLNLLHDEQAVLQTKLTDDFHEAK